MSPLNTVDTAVAAGIVWVNAAGNAAQQTWFKRGPFSYSTINVGDQERKVINFDGSDFSNGLNDPRGARIQLRWDDSWGGSRPATSTSMSGTAREMSSRPARTINQEAQVRFPTNSFISMVPGNYWWPTSAQALLTGFS